MKFYCITDAETLRNKFRNYFPEKEIIEFSNIDSMDLSIERFNIYVYTDGSGFALEYDLPINEDWSDFIAQFSFRKIKKLVYDIYLTDIHIL